MLQELRQESIEYCIAIDAYCAMPDHLHLLARGLNSASNMLNFLRRFKGQTTRWYATKTNRYLWQKKFYDYILRTGDDGGPIASYIWLNPVRRGICTDPVATHSRDPSRAIGKA
jgi:REP element-mobilizing transposase RayT